MALLLLAALLLFFPGCGEKNSSGHHAMDLGGNWKIRVEAPDGGLSPSREISIPGSWNSIIQKQNNFTATVHIEKKVFIKKDIRGKSILLSLGRIGISDELYINDKLIGRTGTIPQNGEKYHFAWQMPRHYFLPPSLVKYGEENSIRLRIFSQIVSGIEGPVTLNFSEKENSHGLQKTHLPLIFNIVAIALNILFFAAMVILYFSTDRKRIYLYFSCMAFFTIAGNFSVLDLPFAVDGSLRARTFLATYSLVNFFALVALKRFFEIKNKYISPVATLLVALTAGAVIFTPGIESLINYAAPAALIFANASLLTVTVLFVFALKRDPRQYWYFLFVAIPVPLSALRNSWYLATLRFYELPLLIFMHIPLAFSIFLLYYIFDLERAKNEKDSLYAALLKKSKNIERILRSLQKDNAKPEPRDIIQDVVEHLDTNYQERYDRRELSKKFDLNEDYMGQLFKKVTGTNISTYLNVRRIDAAKELLIDTDAKIIDIAYHIGFDNLTHFHRQFKKQTNLTPNQYRTLMTKEIEK